MPIDLNDLRLYDPENVCADGYPPEWHWRVKHAVKELADYRCVRCGHPYRKGDGQWSTCDDHCTHGGPVRYGDPELVGGQHGLAGGQWYALTEAEIPEARENPTPGWVSQAEYRILTVHHMNGVKYDCRWWNLAALCQRCHLIIQGRVKMEQVYPFEHAEWFKPYAAGYYASAYLGVDLTREETEARLDELLALERIA